MRYFCTYFDRNYLAKGLTLINSLRVHQGNNFKIFVVCMDEYTRVILNRLAMPQIHPIALHEIEHGDSELLACRENRSVVEYLWTMTSTSILRILERHPEVDLLTYLDADMFLFSSPEVIFKELGNRSVLIHPHRFSPEHKASEKYGLFNVGLLSFKNDAQALTILRWWRSRCIEYCHARYENGLYGDQKYLDQWPSMLGDSLAITQNIGVGTAPWNHSQYSFSERNDGQIYVNDSPLVVYHFHSFAIINPEVTAPVSDTGYRFPVGVAQYCFTKYASALRNSIQQILSIVPDFRFGILNSKLQLSHEHSLLISDIILPEIAKMSLPQQQTFSHANWSFFSGEQSLR